MTGKASRDKGARWELAVARFLSDAWGIEVVTTRNMRRGLQSLSGDLAEKVADIGYRLPLGWSIEVKDHGASAVPTWLAQARQSADGNGCFVVVHKARRAPISDARCWLYPAMWLSLVRGVVRSEEPFGEPRWLPLDAWAALALRHNDQRPA